MNDTALSIIAVLVLGAVICFFVYFLLPARKKNADKIPEDKFDVTKFKKEVTEVRLKGDDNLLNKGGSYVPPANTTPASRSTGNATLDYMYAMKNDLWVCPACETLNPRDRTQCVACGKLKKNGMSMSPGAMSR